MRKKVVIAAGGTGGHLFPAQALAASLKEKYPDIEVLFMAKGLQNNKHFLDGNIQFLIIRISCCIG